MPGVKTILRSERIFILVTALSLALDCAPHAHAQAVAQMTARDYYAELGDSRRLDTSWGGPYACFNEGRSHKAFFIFDAQYRDFDEHGKVTWSFGPSDFKKHSDPSDDDVTQLLLVVTIYQRGVPDRDKYVGGRESTANDVAVFTFTMKKPRDWARLSLTPGTWRYHLELAGRYVEWFGEDSSQKKVDEYGQCEFIPEKWRKEEAR
jgi:hypothetical protein